MVLRRQPCYSCLQHHSITCCSYCFATKTATLDGNTYETTGILSFRMYMQFKSLCWVNSLLFTDNSEPYLPSLITESDSQQVTRSASSYKFWLPEHNRSADEDFYYAAAKLWNNLHRLITSASCQPHPTSNYQFL